MRQKLRSRRPSHATVVAYLALFVALGGTGAWATHEVILSSDIVNGEVKTPDLANLGVTNPKLGPNAVTSGKVLDNNLQGLDLKDGTVGTADLVNGAVTPAKFGTIPAARVEKSANQSVPNATTTNLTFAFENFDTADLHNPANNTRLRAPISGVYQISAGVHWDFNSTGTRELRLMHGNTPFARSVIGPPETGDSAQSVSDLLKLSTGEFVEAQVFQVSGGGSLNALAGASTFLAMTWVGPG
jgi:hypothetical protein